MDSSRPITTIQYTDAIYGLDQGGVRCFLIVGSERALLLDTGWESEELCQRIAEITDKPVTVALTHGDGDHTGGLKNFDTVFVHAQEIARLQAAAEAGISLEPVAEGYIFDLGNIHLRVLHTPGHTPGSICLLDDAHRVLFSGDSVSHGPVFLFGANRDATVFAATLARLEALGGFDTIYCCHGDCPVGPDTIGELRACIAGILDGTLEGKEPARAFGPGMAVREYTVGQSGIYAP